MFKKLSAMILALIFVCSIQTTLAATNPLKLLFPSRAVQSVSVNGTGTSLPTPTTIYPPTATASSFTIYRSVEGNITERSGMLEAADPQDYPLTYAIDRAPTLGTLTSFNSSTGSFTYTPTRNRIGEDSFDFSVTATNGTESSLSSDSKRVSITIIPNLAPFVYEDLSNHWCKNAAEQLIHKAVIGQSVKQRYYFEPNRKMTRAEFVMFLNSVLDVPRIASATSVFVDVEKDYHKVPINSARERNVVSGLFINGNRYFFPDQTITRFEAVMMIYKALNVPNISSTINFSDSNKIPSWGWSAMQTALAYGIVNNNYTRFRPDDGLTRAEAASMLYNAYEQNVKILNP